ncbi:MAG TPA: polysaccharide deacetylase family protein [Clostridia bacterium]|nr:polysaccharide deacetylase family protein [Clostridia bacterium]
MKIIRKIMSLVIPIVFMFQLTVPAKTETDTVNLFQENKVLCARFDLDRMLAYSFSDCAGFIVYDVKNPKEPASMAHLDLDAIETTTSIDTYGSVIYLTAGNSLRVIDVSDPYHPALSFNTCVQSEESLAGFVISGNRAYLFDRCNVHVFSLENPAVPAYLKSYELTDPGSSNSISGVAIHDDIIYAAMAGNGVHVFDFTNLNDIGYLGKLTDVQGSCAKILSYGELVFVFIPEADIVEVLNVSDSKSPRIAGIIQAFSSAWPDFGIQSYKNLLFLPEGPDKLHVVDTTSPEAVIQTGLIDLTGVPAGIGIKEDSIYIFDNQGNIDVMNIDSLNAAQSEDSTPAEKAEDKATVKTAYITIDDGPSRNNTPRNLDTLKKYGVKATFFVLPRGNLDDVYRRIIDEGHVIGNHSTVHDYNNLYGSVSYFRNDVLMAQSYIYDKFQYRMTVYRFPGGTMGRKKAVVDERSEILKELGYKYYNWDVSTADTDPNLAKIGNREQIVNKLADNVIKGAKGRKKLIILMHDSAGKAYSAEALPKIIEGLQEEGYVFDVLTNY